MATILLAWELGAGFGHLANMLPLAYALRARGDNLHFASRDLARLPRDIRADSKLWQAPAKSSQFKRAIASPRSYADIVHNCGFGEASELHAISAAWMNLYAATRPDIVLCEHSPTALLAARQMGIPAIMLGTGFCCPIPERPLRDLRIWTAPDDERSGHTEQLLLDHCNQILESNKRLEYFGQLFDVPSLAMTVPELDPYGVRPLSEYCGAWSYQAGVSPVWPKGSGPRVFAYLNSFATLPLLLAMLIEMQLPSLVVGVGIAKEVQRNASGSSLTFVDQPLDMNQVLKECDIGICNANHGTTIGLLSAGRPALYLPLHLEQTLTAHVVHRLGGGLMASIHHPEQIALRLLEVLRNPQFAVGALEISRRWQRWHAPDRLRMMLSVIDRCLNSRV